MSYFAELNQAGVVLRVIVADSIEWCQSRLGGSWVETKYDASQRKNYAGIGFKFDAQIDAFVPPKLIANHKLNPDTARWEFDKFNAHVIYILLPSDLAKQASLGLGLLTTGKEILYCEITQQKGLDESYLKLIGTDVINADKESLVTVLKTFMEAPEVDAVAALFSQEITVDDCLPKAWKRLTQQEAIDAGYVI